MNSDTKGIFQKISLGHASQQPYSPEDPAYLIS